MAMAGGAGAGAGAGASSSHRSGVIYPSPLLTHVEVSTNPTAFLHCVRNFHSAMGTRFMVPVVGGKELSLHQLYVQVTRRGGFEKVITERKWREVIATFKFPTTATSASFVLRKYYLNLLYHFEQVYFFQAHGPLVTPPAILQTRPMSKLYPRHSSVSDSTMKRKIDEPMSSTGVSALPSQTAKGSGSVACDSAQQSRAAGESKLTVAQSVTLNGDGNGVAASGSVPIAPSSGEATPTAGEIPPGTQNYNITGTIDGKFEHGYFATVRIGSQILHGVLYHVHPVAASYNSALIEASSHEPREAPSPFAPLPSTAINIRSVSRRRKNRMRDPSVPEPNRSAYDFFFAEKHSKLRVLYPHQEKEYSRMVGESWCKLTEQERKVYDDYGRWDKKRYKKELQEYRERMRAVPLREAASSSDAVREVVRENEVGKDEGSGDGQGGAD